MRNTKTDQQLAQTKKITKHIRSHYTPVAPQNTQKIKPYLQNTPLNS